MLESYDEIVAAVLPTLGPERRETYSPILPIHPETGVVEQVRLDRVDASAATVFWTDGHGKKFETSVLAGRPSANGRRTGRCAGGRWASITKCPART